MKINVNSKLGTQICIYDDADHELLSKYNWYIDSNGYVAAMTRENGKRVRVLMHRLILGLTGPTPHCDHKNRNKLDNQRDNLRKCSRSENLQNRTPWGKSKYLGVSFFQGKPMAYIVLQGKKKHLGYFKTEEDAAKARDREALLHHGEFANLNF